MKFDQVFNVASNFKWFLFFFFFFLKDSITFLHCRRKNLFYFSRMVYFLVL